MRRIFRILILLAVTFYAFSAGAEDLRVNGFGVEPDAWWGRPKWYNEWRQRNPGQPLSVVYDAPYAEDEDVIRALRGQRPFCDVLRVWPTTFNFQKLAQAGVLADLSQDPRLLAAAEKMYPAFVQSLTDDEGRLLGMPIMVLVNFLCVQEDAWTLAGYTKADIPASYPAYLDFLEAWAARCRAEPQEKLCVFNGFGHYTASSYAEWLTEQFVHFYADWCSAQGRAIVFDTPETVALLTRIYQVGNALHGADDPTNDYDLFGTNGNWNAIPFMIPFRLTDDDPLCIPVTLDVLCVPENTPHLQQALDFVSLYVECLESRDYDYSRLAYLDIESLRGRAELFPDANEPVPGLDPGSIWWTGENIALYRAYAPYMRPYMANSCPALYDREARALQQQFARGEISAQAFARALDALLAQ